jgi:hypothetical protein
VTAKDRSRLLFKLREDFCYRTETLVARAEKHGLAARFMDDWQSTGHEQSKLRVTRRADPAGTSGIRLPGRRRPYPSCARPGQD